MMKKSFNRLITALLMAAVMVTMTFAMAPADAHAASKAPAAPKITKASVYDNNNVKLTWGKVSGAKKYEVWRKAGNGKYKKIVTTAKRTYQNKKLAYATKYTYKVKAVGKSSKSKFSKVKTLTTKTARPAITSIEQTGEKLTELTVKWKKIKGAVKYKVYAKEAGGKYKLQATTSSLSYVHKDTKSGTTYTYKVTAVDSKARTRTSAEKSKLRERVATVTVPEYYAGTVYWIRDAEDNVIWKGTDAQELDSKLKECWGNGMQISYGGNDPNVNIITGYKTFILTETEFKDEELDKGVDDTWTITWN